MWQGVHWWQEERCFQNENLLNLVFQLCQDVAHISVQIKFCGYTNPYTTNCYVDNLPTNKQSENRDLNSPHHDSAHGNICCTNSKMGKVLFNIHGSQRWTLPVPDSSKI